MRIVKRKWFKSSLIFLLITILTLLLAASAMAQGYGPGPGGSGPGGPGPGGPRPEGSKPGGPTGPGPAKAPEGPKCVGGTVSGVAWYDGNGNNNFDPDPGNPRRGEHYMDGAIIHLWSARDGSNWKGPAYSVRVGTLITRDGGAFKFECVRPGFYSLQAIPPSSHVDDILSLPNIKNPTEPFEVKPDDELVFAFAFKPYLEFISYPYLNVPPRTNP